MEVHGATFFHKCVERLANVYHIDSLTMIGKKIYKYKICSASVTHVDLLSFECKDLQMSYTIHKTHVKPQKATQMVNN